MAGVRRRGEWAGPAAAGFAPRGPVLDRGQPGGNMEGIFARRGGRRGTRRTRYPKVAALSPGPRNVRVVHGPEQVSPVAVREERPGWPCRAAPVRRANLVDKQGTEHHE